MFESKKQKYKKITEDFLKYFTVEEKDGITSAYGDITDEDLKTWLYAVTQAIGKSFNRHTEIKNYLMGQFFIGGQQIEFAFVKNGKEGPHIMRMKLEEENKKLKEDLEYLRQKKKKDLELFDRLIKETEEMSQEEFDVWDKNTKYTEEVNENQ